MKKVLLMLAFTGLVGSISASNNFDDKDKGKKDSKKEAKCCKEKSGEGKTCSADKKDGKCCKKSGETKSTETKPAGSK